MGAGLNPRLLAGGILKHVGWDFYASTGVTIGDMVSNPRWG
ncbi:MAG: hypothetical protein CM1200mP39_09490 [Dehalococcoidia bacterium]|nr:MAG: hypothetical protein CM1200mP39_09490 [Dehalococcoidia bacterium]